MPRVSFTKAENEPSVVWPQLYFGLGFTTLATLILALSLDQIFAALGLPSGWFAACIAVFGLGAGGVFARTLARWRGGIWSKLGWVALLDSLVLAATLTLILSVEKRTIATEALIFFAAVLPFAGSGAVAVSVLAEAQERLDRAVLSAFAGAAAGCLLLVPFLRLFKGAPNTVLASGAIFAISAAIWSHQAGGNARRASAVLVALLFTWVMVVNGKMHLLDIRPPAAAQPAALAAFVGLVLAGLLIAALRWRFKPPTAP